MTSAARLTLVAGMLVALSVWTTAHARITITTAPDFETMVPVTMGEWTGSPAPALDPGTARVLAADEYVHRFYERATADLKLGTTDNELRTTDNEPRTTDNESIVEMDVAYYARPQAGAAMHSPLNCLPGNGWQVIESHTIPVNVDGGSVDVRRLIVSRGSDRVAMTYWFQNRGAVVAHELGQRVRLLTNGLRRRPTDAALVRVMASDTSDGNAAVLIVTRELLSRLRSTFR